MKEMRDGSSAIFDTKGVVTEVFLRSIYKGTFHKSVKPFQLAILGKGAF
jgi:hypothetical protein